MSRQNLMNGKNRHLFGHMPNNAEVEEITLTDGSVSCGILTYGGALRRLTVPDRHGEPVDVLLGFDSLEAYMAQDKYMGALVGRCANRIGGSRFVLGEREYLLPANDGPNHLHGGLTGFDKQLWQVRSQTENTLSLTLTSPDGQEGYPGKLEVQVIYTLRDGALEIGYQAQSDQTTVCNLTNHAYFNLSGHASGNVDREYIQLSASRYTPVDSGLIPTGEIAPVENTVLDLRKPQPIGTRAYDHNFTVDGWDGTLRTAARTWSPDTGIFMEVLTTLPGVQFYTGNFLNGCPAGKGGAVYANRGAFCLETQFYPDSPNHANFPSIVLPAGAVYQSKTVYRFETGEKFL